MCGIAGIVLRPGVDLPDLGHRLEAMNRALRHRGPDDSGAMITPDGHVALGNRRLAVRDCSPAGHMPMGRPDGRLWITYNGECYNSGELRAQLEGAGYRFRSTTDTEVLLHGYHAWGDALLERVNGMFALALYADEGPSGRTLLLARDQLGVKPLYYALTSSGLIFASELRALLASGLVSAAIDPAGLVAYLLLGSVPAPLTIYSGVAALEPGQALRLKIDDPGFALRLWRYWRLPDATEPLAPAEAVEHTRKLLVAAVRDQMVSDVPLGAFLSGGVDSSVIVSLMRAAGARTIRTCSIAFAEDSYSEASHARAVAEALGTEHHERLVTARDARLALGAVFAAMDQPSIDGLNSYFVAQTAREAGLTVALSGLGGDELFGGYPSFRGVPRLLARLHMATTVPGARMAGRIGESLPVASRWVKLAAAMRSPASPASAFLVYRGLFVADEVRSLVTPEVWQAAAARFDPVGYIMARAGRADDSAAWVSRAELSSYTVSQLLRDTDVMSMAHSLEVRVPLLDRRLVEATLRLPGEARLDGEGPKPLLVAAAAPFLPGVVKVRRPKQGFVFPLDAWLRGPLEAELPELGADLRAMLRPHAVDEMWRRFLVGRDHWARAWALFALRGWAAAA